MAGKAKKRVVAPAARQKQAPKRTTLPGADDSNLRICWRFTHVDHDGPWGFDKISGQELVWIMNQLKSFESMTIRELFNRGDEPGKHYEIERIPNPRAASRLDALGLGDMTRISRLRLTGTRRLYGFLEGHIFHVVWWDPEHEIWPSKLRNT